MIQTLSLVALGGAAGSAMRHLVTLAALRAFGPGFPAGTMVVNVAGSFLMGMLAVLLAGAGGRLPPLLMTGVLGGFTTFSAFSLDAVALWERGATVAAGGYVLGSVILSVAALVLGMVLARGLAG